MTYRHRSGYLKIGGADPVFFEPAWIHAPYTPIVLVDRKGEATASRLDNVSKVIGNLEFTDQAVARMEKEIASELQRRQTAAGDDRPESLDIVVAAIEKRWRP